jgi:outer membrane lipoprotein-sorting protein
MAVLVAAGGLLPLPAADAAEMREIIAAWSRRQNAVRSLVVRWTESRSANHARQKNKEATGDRWDYEMHSTLKCDDLRMEYITEINAPEGSNLAGYRRALYDGHSSWSFTRGNDGVSHAGTRTSQRFKHISDVAIMAGLLPVYRGMVPECAKMNIHDATITGTGTVDQHDCIIISAPRKDSHASELWLDPSLEFAPRRWLSMVGDQPSLRVDISYSAETQHGIPQVSEFTMQHIRDDGSLGLTSKANVVEMQFNVPIDPQAFVMTYPPGTSVIDRVDKRDYRVPGGGVPRHGEAKEPGGWPIWVWGLAAAAVIAVAVVAHRIRERMW